MKKVEKNKKKVERVEKSQEKSKTSGNIEKIEKSGKSTGVTLPDNLENKREDQVSDGRALNDDPREDDATDAKTQPEQKRKFKPNA